MTNRKTGRGSDQFPLRLPDGLRDRIKSRAEKIGYSMNETIVRVLEREFPPPITLEEQTRDLLELIASLKQGRVGGSIDRIAEELFETLDAIRAGRIKMENNDVQRSIRKAFQAWEEAQFEKEQDRYYATDVSEIEESDFSRPIPDEPKPFE